MQKGKDESDPYLFWNFRVFLALGSLSFEFLGLPENKPMMESDLEEVLVRKLKNSFQNQEKDLCL